MRQVSKSFGRRPILSDITLDLSDGEIGAILGPSGAGKSTLLALIAGLERASHGSVSWRGDRWDSEGSFVPPERRSVGYVFQDFALFPHLTVTENVAFGLRLRRTERTAVARKVEDLLSRMRLEGLGARYPHQLSGGQKQRVAVARSLATEPAMLLFDESLSSLDAKLRDELRLELRDLLRSLRLTALFVTHDPLEAMLLSDRMFVLEGGRLLAQGTPQALYASPPSREVAQTLGPAWFWPVRLLPGTAGNALIEVGDAQIALSLASPPPPGRYEMMLRPSSATVTDQGDLRAAVTRSVYVGGAFQVALRLPSGASLEVRCPRPPGDEVSLHLDPSLLHFLPAD